MDKTTKWVTWWFVKVKIDKESIILLKETINILKEDMENYHWTMFIHAMDFFPKRASLKTPIQEYFFTSLLHDLVSLGNFLSTKFMKPSRWLYATLGKWT
jgi:hypothetical protein